MSNTMEFTMMNNRMVNATFDLLVLLERLKVNDYWLIKMHGDVQDFVYRMR